MHTLLLLYFTALTWLTLLGLVLAIAGDKLFATITLVGTAVLTIVLVVALLRSVV